MNATEKIDAAIQAEIDNRPGITWHQGARFALNVALTKLEQAERKLNPPDPRPNFRKGDVCHHCAKRWMSSCTTVASVDTCDNFEREKVVLCGSCKEEPWCADHHKNRKECRGYKERKRGRR